METALHGGRIIQLRIVQIHKYSRTFAYPNLGFFSVTRADIHITNAFRKSAQIL